MSKRRRGKESTGLGRVNSELTVIIGSAASGLSGDMPTGDRFTYNNWLFQIDLRRLGAILTSGVGIQQFLFPCLVTNSTRPCTWIRLPLSSFFLSSSFLIYLFEVYSNISLENIRFRKKEKEKKKEKDNSYGKRPFWCVSCLPLIFFNSFEGFYVQLWCVKLIVYYAYFSLKW